MCVLTKQISVELIKIWNLVTWSLFKLINSPTKLKGTWNQNIYIYKKKKTLKFKNLSSMYENNYNFGFLCY